MPPAVRQFLERRFGQNVQVFFSTYSTSAAFASTIVRDKELKKVTSCGDPNMGCARKKKLDIKDPAKLACVQTNNVITITVPRSAVSTMVMGVLRTLNMRHLDRAPQRLAAEQKDLMRRIRLYLCSSS